MSQATLLERLARLVAETRLEDLPAEVVRSVKARVLDTLGICVAAADLDTSRAIAAYASSQGGSGEAHAIGVRQTLPAALAALVNGTLAHSLDYDDTHLPSIVHPSATIVPACLAAAEAAGAPGRELVAAVAVGLEVCVRLGMAGYDEAARNSTYFDRGQHATSICGAIAAAGAAARLDRLEAAGVLHAMAIAASMASGIIESNRTGGNVKRLHCGWAAHAGISAARLARLGFTGAPSALEGRFGLFRALLDGRFDEGAILDGLGEAWSVPAIRFKPYPANHFTHAGIDAALALRARGLRAAEVERLTLGVAGPTLRTIGEPIEAKRAPKTAYEAQFSGPYTVVAALLGGHGLGLGLEDFTDELARDPSRRALMALVDVVEDAACSERFPNEFPARLRARTAGGAELVEEVWANRGGPGRPLSARELAVKFEDNVRHALDPAAAAELEDLVAGLEGLERPGEILERLGGGRGATGAPGA
ncbi:MAG TPA: MmgE/PrpD family protein [Acidimicrobiales bacterium]|nr:MmgE/PrpD family protein [Acidimicrobiales bacterium]